MPLSLPSALRYRQPAAPRQLLPADGSDQAYSPRNTPGSHIPQNQPAPKSSDTAPVLDHSTCQPALHGARSDGASAQNSFPSASGQSRPPNNLSHLRRHCRSLSLQHRPTCVICPASAAFNATHRLSVSSYRQGNLCGRWPVKAQHLLTIAISPP